MRSKQFDGYFIYTLIDPRDRVVRYIGITRKVDKRLTHHLKDAGISNRRKKAWLTELEQLGLSPQIVGSPEPIAGRASFFNRPGKTMLPSYRSSLMEVFQYLLETMPATLTELAR